MVYMLGDRGSKLLRSYSCRFETWAISSTPLCPPLSEGTLKAVGPFYLVSMPGEIIYPTQVNGKTCRGLNAPHRVGGISP